MFIVLENFIKKNHFKKTYWFTGGQDDCKCLEKYYKIMEEFCTPLPGKCL